MFAADFWDFNFSVLADETFCSFKKNKLVKNITIRTARELSRFKVKIIINLRQKRKLMQYIN